MAENKKKSDEESYVLTEKLTDAVKNWYWMLLLIISVTATIFYAAAKMTYTPAYQSYAAVTPSMRDDATAEEVAAIAKEFTAGAEDGSLMAALAENAGEDVKNADIRFVADGINLAVSVRAPSASLSYETLRAFVTRGVQLLADARDYELVLVSESGMPYTVTNPLDVEEAAHRGLLAGAGLALIFLFAAALRSGKKAPEEEPRKAAEPVREEEPRKAEPVKPAAFVRAARPDVPEPLEESAYAELAGEAARFLEPAVRDPSKDIWGNPLEESAPAAAVEEEFAEEPVPAVSEPEAFAEEVGFRTEPAAAEPEPAAAEPEEVAEEPEEVAEEPVSVPEAIDVEPEAEKYKATAAEKPEPSAEPAAARPAENTPEKAAASDDEEWDPTKTILSKEMWEVAREMGLLDEFRI